MRSEMTADEVFTAFLGDFGAPFRSAMILLSVVSAERLRAAVSAIDRETALGPLLRPSAYVDGTRFENARAWSALF